MNRVLVIFSDNAHGCRFGIDDEQSSAAKGYEVQDAGGVDDRADRSIVWPQRCTLAGEPVWSRAGGQIDSGGVIQHERIGLEIGVDALVELAVLVGHSNISLIRRGK